MYKDFDIFPAYKPAYSDPVFNQPNSFYAGQVTSQVFITAQEKLQTDFYYGSKSTDLDQIISNEVITALTGKKTPAQALKDADTTFNHLLGNN
jgi:ABC-type glycerol-3-phosphate transport system substrate-binding protein